jgi:hypothetical protein
MGWWQGTLAVSGLRRDHGRNASGALVMTLARWRVAALRTDEPAEIRCLSGQLWITEPGKLDDVVIRAGQGHAVAGPARDILLSTVGTEEAARFEIVPGRLATRNAVREGAAHFQLRFA